MKITDFDFDLPPERIAQQPLADRAASRMLVLHRAEQRWEDRVFRDLPSYLGPGDCLVLNNSRVFPARLFGRRAGVFAHPLGAHNPKLREHLSGQVEVFLLRPVTDDELTWEALVRPGRKIAVGERIQFGEGLAAETVARGEFGLRQLRFTCNSNIWETLDRLGHIPLPPYIKRDDAQEDRERYQTVFAQQSGSVAAPTAGLHFTPAILDACRAAGAETAQVTLHVGLGTFQPLHAEDTKDVKLHAERYRLTADSWRAIQSAKRRIAVGTTSVRTIETAAARGEFEGETDLFISPGFAFQLTDAMVTNFHLPQSSLLALVCALAGRELTLAAYAHAVRANYRFYSYGDCMLVL